MPGGCGYNAPKTACCGFYGMASALTQLVNLWWLGASPGAEASCNDIQALHEGLIAAGLWPLTDRFFELDLLESDNDCLMLKVHAMRAVEGGVVVQLLSDCYTVRTRWVPDNIWLIEAAFKVHRDNTTMVVPCGQATASPARSS